jgi:hypothetical protein
MAEQATIKEPAKIEDKIYPKEEVNAVPPKETPPPVVEKKPDETKPEVKPAEPKKEEKFELKLPEGSLLEPKTVEEIAAFARERGFSQEQAQAVLEREGKAVSKFVEAQKATLTEQTALWLEDAKKDKELGGEAFEKNSELAKRVVHRFGSESLRKALDETGLGNHPELVRFCVRLGKAMKEDQLIVPGPQPGPKRSAEELFYGKSEKPK